MKAKCLICCRVRLQTSKDISSWSVFGPVPGDGGCGGGDSNGATVLYVGVAAMSPNGIALNYAALRPSVRPHSAVRTD